MKQDQIAVLLKPFLDSPLIPIQLQQISTYVDLLLRWNARINLTAIRDPEQMLTRHFGESLFLARHLFSANPAGTAPSVIDIGSGAGFPALVLKIWEPGIQLTMIESNHKKAAFLREIGRSLGLAGVNVLADRAEALAATGAFNNMTYGHIRAGTVTLRAVEDFPKILRVAIRFLLPEARLAMLIGKRQLTVAEATLDLSWRVYPVPESLERIVAIGVRQRPVVQTRM
jgi:16S rRNA (guanine527-N7)-methyltransferase